MFMFIYMGICIYIYVYVCIVGFSIIFILFLDVYFMSFLLHYESVSIFLFRLLVVENGVHLPVSLSTLRASVWSLPR